MHRSRWLPRWWWMSRPCRDLTVTMTCPRDHHFGKTVIVIWVVCALMGPPHLIISYSAQCTKRYKITRVCHVLFTSHSFSMRLSVKSYPYFPMHVHVSGSVDSQEQAMQMDRVSQNACVVWQRADSAASRYVAQRTHDGCHRCVCVCVCVCARQCFFFSFSRKRNFHFLSL